MSLGDLPIGSLVDDNTPGPIASFNQGGVGSIQFRWYNLNVLDSDLDSPDQDIKTYMVVIRNITVTNAPNYMMISFPFANSIYKVCVLHWTTMTTGQNTYTASFEWSPSQIIKVDYTSNCTNDTCFFKVTFV